MNFQKISLLIILFSSACFTFSQTDSIEVELIDAYCTRDIPYTFKLSFYTSELCRSKVILEDKYDFDVSKNLTDFHKIDLDISKLDFEQQVVNFVIVTEDSLGNKFRSETYDFDLPIEPKIKSGSSLFTLCLFGTAIFLVPYPGYVYDGSKSYFSLTKEIPVISFRSRSLNYPSGYISLEYSYIFNAEDPSYLRAGYKKLIELPYTKYVSPGLSAYTNFNKNYGLSPELSVGLFTIKDTFTFYVRYRYNIHFNSGGANFQEINLGLYSGFFSFYLD